MTLKLKVATAWLSAIPSEFGDSVCCLANYCDEYAGAFFLLWAFFIYQFREPLLWIDGMFKNELDLKLYPRVWAQIFPMLLVLLQKKTPALGRGFKYFITGRLRCCSASDQKS